MSKEKRIKKVYIAGKIGEDILSDSTRKKFAEAEAWLKAKGYKVFNPTQSRLGIMAENYAKACGTNFYEEILLLDIMQLKRCDIICLLPDWHESPGALAEFFFAKAIGKKIKQITMFENKIVDWI